MGRQKVGDGGGGDGRLADRRFRKSLAIEAVIESVDFDSASRIPFDSVYSVGVSVNMAIW